MLQMVPMMSKHKAQALLLNESYSCPRKLFNFFHNNPDPEVAQLPPVKKMLLLQNEFGKSKSGAVKKEAKLSKHLYNLMTSTEPDAVICDV